MIRGTTPTHIFNLPFSVNEIKSVRITYEQNGENVLEKTEAHCLFSDKAIIVKLTQEETLLFEGRRKVYVQLKALTMTGDVLSHKAKAIDVNRCLTDEVLQ